MKITTRLDFQASTTRRCLGRVDDTAIADDNLSMPITETRIVPCIAIVRWDDILFLATITSSRVLER